LINKSYLFGDNYFTISNIATIVHIIVAFLDFPTRGYFEIALFLLSLQCLFLFLGVRHRVDSALIYCFAFLAREGIFFSLYFYHYNRKEINGYWNHIYFSDSFSLNDFIISQI